MGKETYKVNYLAKRNHNQPSKQQENSLEKALEYITLCVVDGDEDIKLSVLIDNEVDQVFKFFPDKNGGKDSCKYFGWGNGGLRSTAGDKNISIAIERSQHFSNLYEELISEKNEALVIKLKDKKLEPKGVYRYRASYVGNFSTWIKLDDALESIYNYSKGKFHSIELHVLDGDRVVQKFSFDTPTHSLFWCIEGELHKGDEKLYTHTLNSQYEALVTELVQEKEAVETYQVTFKSTSTGKTVTGSHKKDLQSALEYVLDVVSSNYTNIKMSISRDGVVDRVHEYRPERLGIDWEEDDGYFYPESGAYDDESYELDKLYTEIIKNTNTETISYQVDRKHNHCSYSRKFYEDEGGLGSAIK